MKNRDRVGTSKRDGIEKRQRSMKATGIGDRRSASRVSMRNRLGGLTSALVPMVLLAGCQPAAPAATKLPPVVDAETVHLAPFASSVTLTGVVAAADTINHAFRTSGRVARRLVDVGGRVEEGQVLAELDSVEQQADLRGAEAGLVAAKAQLRQAKSNFERQQQLLDGGVITRRVFDEAEQALRMAESSMQIAQAQVISAREALGYVQLLAEASGIVLSHAIEAGQVVQAAQTVIGIAADGDRDAVFNVDEALAAAYAEPPRVELALLNDPGISAPGVIRELSPAVNAQTGTVRVKVAIQGTPPNFVLGAPVVGSIVPSPFSAIVLPWQALIETEGASAVWVLDPETQTVSTRPINVAVYGSHSIVVSEGLEEGEVVVTQGAYLLKPDQKVIVREQVQ